MFRQLSLHADRQTRKVVKQTRVLARSTTKMTQPRVERHFIGMSCLLKVSNPAHPGQQAGLLRMVDAGAWHKVSGGLDVHCA
jgi:hypothetical protein